MKKFKDFIIESKKLISDKTSNSIVYTSSKNDITKESNLGTYSDVEIQLFQVMKKRPDLFCKILKIDKNRVLTEKLDIITFLKDYKKNDDDWMRKFNTLKFHVMDYLGDEFDFNENITIDLNYNNFGYIKGTKEIRCFDPVSFYKDYLKRLKR